MARGYGVSASGLRTQSGQRGRDGLRGGGCPPAASGAVTPFGCSPSREPHPRTQACQGDSPNNAVVDGPQELGHAVQPSSQGLVPVGEIPEDKRAAL